MLSVAAVGGTRPSTQYGTGVPHAHTMQSRARMRRAALAPRVSAKGAELSHKSSRRPKCSLPLPLPAALMAPSHACSLGILAVA